MHALQIFHFPLFVKSKAGGLKAARMHVANVLGGFGKKRHGSKLFCIWD